MPSVSLNVRHQIGVVIKRFKFEELESAVLPIFPEFSWKNIKAKLVKNHESLTTAHALCIIDEEIHKANIADKVLKDRLATLEVIDVSRHYKRKIWYCHEFKGKIAPNFLTIQDIQEQIRDSFHKYQMEVDVRVVQHNGIIFVSIQNRPKKRQMKTILPTYFSLIMNETFFFCSRRVVLKNALMAITDGMGYQSCKQVKLTGKDIPALVQMLLSRKTAQLQGDIIKEPIRFKQTPPVTTSLGLDFTQQKTRKEYAEKCFGDEAPTFEFLRVKSLDQKWKHKDVLEKLPDEIIYTGIEFRSSNIPQFLKNLVTQRILLTPLPCYAANIISLGRNDLTIKESQS